MQTTCYLIPVYDNQAGLDVSLRSIFRERAASDVVVVDDGSRIPVNLASEFAGRPGRAVSIIRLNQNGGISEALNAGLERIMAAGYTYVARLDAGDTVAPERIERQAGFLDANPEVALVGSDVAFQDRGGSVLYIHRTPQSHDEIVRALRFNNCLLHPAVTARVAVLRRVGGYDGSVPVAEDYELFQRIAVHNRLASLPELLTTTVFAPRGISLTHRFRQQRARLWVQRRYFNPWVLSSYLGIARTLACIAIPTRLVIAWKRRRTILTLPYSFVE